jgi:hypothetical protein
MYIVGRPLCPVGQSNGEGSESRGSILIKPVNNPISHSREVQSEKLLTAKKFADGLIEHWRVFVLLIRYIAMAVLLWKNRRGVI